MTDPELEELAGLWQDSDPAEVARFEALARRAQRKGRLLGYADLALAALLVGGTLFGTLMTPHPTTIAAAFLLIGATVWLTWKRRGLRQMAATLNTTDPAAFLESSVRNATANLRRVTLNLMLIPLFMACAILFRASRNASDVYHLLEGVWEWVSSARGTGALIIVALLLASLVRSRRRLRGELRQLEDLRRDYEEERQREEGLR